MRVLGDGDRLPVIPRNPASSEAPIAEILADPSHPGWDTMLNLVCKPLYYTFEPRVLEAMSTKYPLEKHQAAIRAALDAQRGPS